MIVPLTAPRFSAKVVVITAGASGMGAACVRRFLAEGAKVVMADVDCDAAQRRIEECGSEALSFIETDVTDRVQMEQLMQTAVDMHGRIDVLHNHAGLAMLGSVTDLRLIIWLARRSRVVGVQCGKGSRYQFHPIHGHHLCTRRHQDQRRVPRSD